MHAHGAAIIAQIYHAGPAEPRGRSSTPTPSPRPPSPAPSPLEMPRELTHRGGRADRRAVRRLRPAGQEGRLRRGGDPRRTRLPGLGVHVLVLQQALRQVRRQPVEPHAVPARDRRRTSGRSAATTFVIQFRISADEMVHGRQDDRGHQGDSPAAGAGRGRQLRRHRGDRWQPLHVRCRRRRSATAGSRIIAAEVKKVVEVPVFTVGRINDPLIAESIVASGKADGVAMGRGSLADPELPNKAREGRFEDIIQCTGCMQGCVEQGDWRSFPCAASSIRGPARERVRHHAGAREEEGLRGGRRPGRAWRRP